MKRANDKLVDAVNDHIDIANADAARYRNAALGSHEEYHALQTLTQSARRLGYWAARVATNMRELGDVE